MELHLTSEQALLRDSAAKFVGGAGPKVARKFRDGDLSFAPQRLREAGALGWLGILVPEAVQGVGPGLPALAAGPEQRRWGGGAWARAERARDDSRRDSRAGVQAASDAGARHGRRSPGRPGAAGARPWRRSGRAFDAGHRQWRRASADGSEDVRLRRWR